LREIVKGWIGFLFLLLARGGVMTVIGWFVVFIVEKAGRINFLLGVILGIILVLGMGLLYTIMERWP